MLLSEQFYTRLQSKKKNAKMVARAHPDFMEADDWPSSGSDLNPLDYKLWSVPEEYACAQGHQILNLLKAAILTAVREIHMPIIRESISDGPNVCDAACKQKAIILSTIELSLLKYFLSFLKILYRYLLCLRQNICLKYGLSLWLYST